MQSFWYLKCLFSDIKHPDNARMLAYLSAKACPVRFRYNMPRFKLISRLQHPMLCLRLALLCSIYPKTPMQDAQTHPRQGHRVRAAIYDLCLIAGGYWSVRLSSLSALLQQASSISVAVKWRNAMNDQRLQKPHQAQASHSASKHFARENIVKKGFRLAHQHMSVRKHYKAT